MRCLNRRVSLVVCALLSLVSFSVAAQTRNCTPLERSDGDTDLGTLEIPGGMRAAVRMQHLPFGVHLPDNPDNEQLLYQWGYMLSHDPDLRTTLWVSYALDHRDIDGAQGQPRVNCFRGDPRLDSGERATTTDYREPIYDQGHMANDADFKDEILEQVNTYVMSNMSPQHCRFNRGIWLSLEHLGRIWAAENGYGAVHVTSGAIFDRDGTQGRDADDDALRMESNNNRARVAVPSHYYKVFLRQDEDGWHSFSVLLPHTNTNHGVSWQFVRPDVQNAVVSIEEIESLASLTLHPSLDRDELQQSQDGDGWDLTFGRANLNSTISDSDNCVITIP